MPPLTKILIADKTYDAPLRSPVLPDVHFDCPCEYVNKEQHLYGSLQNRPTELLIVDFEFSDKTAGIPFITSLRQNYPRTLILPVIPAGEAQIIRNILELGILYFIHKPLDPLEAILAINRVFGLQKNREPVIPEAVPENRQHYHSMHGSSSEMQQLFTLISKMTEENFSTGLIYGESTQIDFNSLINDFETKLILKALQLTGGNKKAAAVLLNLKRTTLVEKIKKKTIDGLWQKR